MAQINVILWDVDGTLLDFSAAERRALEDCFRSFQMGPLHAGAAGTLLPDQPDLLAAAGAGGADQAPGPAGPL